MDTRTILRKVKDGSLSIEEAELAFGRQPYEELGYAKLDENRKVRQGFPEIIYCSNKPDDYLVSIYCKMFEENGEVKFWSGRGRSPKPIDEALKAGRSLDDFLIKKEPSGSADDKQ